MVSATLNPPASPDSLCSSPNPWGLQAALAQVPRSGWSRESLLAGVRSLGLSPAALGLLPRAEASLVEYFVRQCNRRLEAELASMTPQLAGLRVTQRVHTAVRRRLEMLAPVMDSWPQALVLLARPSRWGGCFTCAVCN